MIRNVLNQLQHAASVVAVFVGLIWFGAPVLFDALAPLASVLWPAGYAAGAGFCFGAMYALLAQVTAADSLVVVFVMRLAGTLALLPGLLQAGQRSPLLIRSGAGIASGLASVGANALYIVAMTTGGSRVAASVLAVALSAPAAMVIVATLGRERLTVMQGASATSAVGAIGILALQSAPFI